MEKWKYQKNEKNTWRLSSFYTNAPKIMMMHDGCNCFSFWGIFCPVTPPNFPKNENFKKFKKIKNAWRYHHFTQLYQKL